MGKPAPTNTYILTELSPSWGTIILQPVKNSPTFYGTRRFNTVFTRALHWSLSWAISLQSKPSHPICLRSILILSNHPRSNYITCNTVAMQRSRQHGMIGNGLVNTFPQKRTRSQLWKNDVSCSVRHETIWRGPQAGWAVQLSIVKWNWTCEENTGRLVWTGPAWEEVSWGFADQLSSVRESVNSYVGKSISKLQMDIEVKKQMYWFEKYFYFST
jgi:hypothetical protein